MNKSPASHTGLLTDNLLLVAAESEPGMPIISHPYEEQISAGRHSASFYRLIKK